MKLLGTFYDLLNSLANMLSVHVKIEKAPKKAVRNVLQLVKSKK